MNCFPFMVPAAGCRCLLTGGGKVALHKARRLALFGVRIVVCAREILPELEELAAQVHREYDVSLLDGADFAVAATSDRAFNARVAEDCRARRVPVNCVDDRAHCDFYFPALIVRGDTVIAVSTGGVSPLAAALLKERIARSLPDDLEERVACAGRLREAGDGEAYERECRRLFEEEI